HSGRDGSLPPPSPFFVGSVDASRVHLGWPGSSSPNSPAGLTHREEKYLAIAYARSFPAYVALRQLDLYRQMIVEGAWWDCVDDVAANLVARIHRAKPERMRPILWEWIDAADMWLRRAALLSQLRSKSDTDAEMLFEFCRRRAHETEFFIRKALGWALREYSKTDPEAVAEFLRAEGQRMSGLSRREAGRHLQGRSLRPTT